MSQLPYLRCEREADSRGVSVAHWVAEAGSADVQPVMTPAAAMAAFHDLWHQVEAGLGAERDGHDILRLSMRAAVRARSWDDLRRRAKRQDLLVNGAAIDASGLFRMGYIEHCTDQPDGLQHQYPPDSSMAHSLGSACLVRAAALVRSSPDGDNLAALHGLRQQIGMPATDLRIYWGLR